MYHHVKNLMYTVNIGTPEPRFGNMLLSNLAAPTANSLPRCNIRFKV